MSRRLLARTTRLLFGSVLKQKSHPAYTPPAHKEDYLNQAAVSVQITANETAGCFTSLVFNISEFLINIELFFFL